MVEEKCCWILSRRWRGLVGLAGAGRCWSASVTKVGLHGADQELKKDNCGRKSTRLAMSSLSSDREQCMQMVFIRYSASLMTDCSLPSNRGVKGLRAVVLQALAQGCVRAPKPHTDVGKATPKVFQNSKSSCLSIICSDARNQQLRPQCSPTHNLAQNCLPYHVLPRIQFRNHPSSHTTVVLLIIP